MFESSADGRPARTVCPAVGALVAAMAGLAMLEPAVGDAELIEQIGWLERVSAAAVGVQVQLMVRLNRPGFSGGSVLPG